MRSGSNILTRGIAEGTGGAIQYNADLLARNIAFGEHNPLDFTSEEARKQFVLSFAIGAVAEVPHAFGSFKGYKAGYSNLDMYQRAADGLWEYENNNKLTVEQLGKSGIIDDRTPETLVAQEIADSRMKSIGLEGAGSKLTNVTKTRVGQWMSKAEYEQFVKTGEIPRTNVLTKGMDGYIKQASKGDFYVEFDIDSSLLAPKNEALGWSLIKSKNQMYLKLYQNKGLTLPNPIGINITHIATK